MLRIFAGLLGVLFSWTVGGQRVWAQASQPWPDYLPEWGGGAEFPHGDGFYLSLVKIILAWLLMLFWVFSTDWINRDAQRLALPFRRWNLIAFSSFAVAFLLLWVLPWFGLSFFLLLAGSIAPVGTYVFLRNRDLNPADKVLTPEHLRFVYSQKMRRLGVKIPAEAPAEKKKRKKGVAVKLTACGGGSARDDTAHLLAARQLPGFEVAGELLTKALAQRAAAVMIDLRRGETALRFHIDGLWHDVDGQDREAGDAALGALKTLAGLDAHEQQARQQGSFSAEDEITHVRYTCKLTSQGTKTGQRALVQCDDGSNKQRRLPDLGMSKPMQQQLEELLHEKQGLILVATPSAGGFTSLLAACTAAVDRYMRNVVAVEDQGKPEMDMENVPVTTFDGAAGESPATVLEKVGRNYPDVVVVPELVNAESVAALCDQVREERLIIVGTGAKETAEALLRVLLLKVQPKRFVPAVTAVVCGRLIRKLCDACKEAYEPPRQQIEKLGLASKEIDAFYRPPQQPSKVVCSTCNGLGYHGQTGIYELLVVDEGVRTTLLTNPKLDAVRQAVRKSGAKTMQQEGLALVAKGVTSLAELQRVLQQ